MNPERLQERIEDFVSVVSQLEKALARPYNEVSRDSVIQRFEFTYGLAWKMLKLRLEGAGVLASTPKQVLQESFRASKIT